MAINRRQFAFSTIVVAVGICVCLLSAKYAGPPPTIYQILEPAMERYCQAGAQGRDAISAGTSHPDLLQATEGRQPRLVAVDGKTCSLCVHALNDNVGTCIVFSVNRLLREKGCFPNSADDVNAVLAIYEERAADTLEAQYKTDMLAAPPSRSIDVTVKLARLTLVLVSYPQGELIASKEILAHPPESVYVETRSPWDVPTHTKAEGRFQLDEIDKWLQETGIGQQPDSAGRQDPEE